ncbi:MAG: LacI family transcriptional regulator [Propionibacterium sp.]|nr:LacI family transcriptional regulator [Propionibacterium sp.]
MHRPTIEDVAKAAGVGRGTVSRVLNGGPVAERTRARVEAAIAVCGYEANVHARSLASGRSDVYAAVLTEPYGEVFEDPTFGLMLQGISSALTGTEISLSLLIATNGDERERAIRHLDPARLDGVIHLTPHIEDPILAALDPTLPTILCGAIDIPRVNLWTVHADDYQGGQLGARHVLERGSRTVAILAGPKDSYSAETRVAGQRDALGSHFRSDLVASASWGGEGGTNAMAALLAHEPAIDAVLCASDRQALGVMALLQALGRRVPDDVRVVGFDDQRFAARCLPPLTTVRQPIAQIGANAAEVLHRALAGGNPESVTLPTELIVRASA